MEKAPSFYEEILEFDRFTDQPVLEATPDIINLTKEFKNSKNCFSIPLSEDENSSDEEGAMPDLTSYITSDKAVVVGGMPDFDAHGLIVAPPTAVEFPVAPASPELESKEDTMFTFLGIF
jgi:hypothetical protein